MAEIRFVSGVHRQREQRLARRVHHLVLLVEHELPVTGVGSGAVRGLQREKTVTGNRQIERVRGELNESLTEFLRHFFQGNTLTHYRRSTLQR